MTSLRAALARRPRVVLATLLAFLVAGLRPALSLVEHTHAGDERTHVHAAGALGGGPQARPSRPTRDGAAAGLYAANDRVHLHAWTPIDTATETPQPAVAQHHLAVTIAPSRAAAAPVAGVSRTPARAPPIARA